MNCMQYRAVLSMNGCTRLLNNPEAVTRATAHFDPLFLGCSAAFSSARAPLSVPIMPR